MANDGGAAFPRQAVKIQRDGKEYTEYVDGASGMSLRAWFAGTIDMPLMEVAKVLAENGIETDISSLIEWRAKLRYLEADAMIAEGDKETEDDCKEA